LDDHPSAPAPASQNLIPKLAEQADFGRIGIAKDHRRHKTACALPNYRPARVHDAGDLQHALVPGALDNHRISMVDRTPQDAREVAIDGWLLRRSPDPEQEDGLRRLVRLLHARHLLLLGLLVHSAGEFFRPARQGHDRWFIANPHGQTSRDAAAKSGYQVRHPV
jgi:hypothetical protein